MQQWKWQWLWKMGAESWRQEVAARKAGRLGGGGDSAGGSREWVEDRPRVREIRPSAVCVGIWEGNEGCSSEENER